MVKTRDWIFTINDIEQYIDDESAAGCWDMLKSLIETKLSTSDDIKGMAFQLERVSHYHIQGFAMFKDSMGREAFKQLLAPFKPHCEKRKGTIDQAIDYCTKEESRVTGTLPVITGSCIRGEKVSNKERRLAWFKRIPTATKAELWEEAPDLFTQNVERLARVRAALTTPRCHAMVNFVLVGPTGIGKTRWVYDTFGIENVYSKDAENKWWEGYEGQECILIDEYNGQWSIEWLLKLLDRYPILGEVKNGHVQIISKFIMITTNKHPREWYTRASAHQLDALMHPRRLRSVFEEALPCLTKEEMISMWEEANPPRGPLPPPQYLSPQSLDLLLESPHPSQPPDSPIDIAAIWEQANLGKDPLKHDWWPDGETP